MDGIYKAIPLAVGEGGFIRIGEENVCNICGGRFMHKRLIKRLGGLEEVHLITSHSNCRKIAQKIKKKQDEIEQLKLSLEWETFLSNDSA